eukprot:scaffold810_cov355-Pavlova_lutheri.AAC.27
MEDEAPLMNKLSFLIVSVKGFQSTDMMANLGATVFASVLRHAAATQIFGEGVHFSRIDFDAVCFPSAVRAAWDCSIDLRIPSR